jgi:hypothetical protein
MPTLHRILRVAVAGLTLAAVVAQLYDSIHRGRSVVNFFSFFTIQSNLLAVVTLVAAAFTARLASLRGAVTLYLATTGIVYALLLAGREEQRYRRRCPGSTRCCTTSRPSQSSPTGSWRPLT